MVATAKPTVPEPLLRAIRQQKCVLFLGSGLSTGAGYPSWPELIHELLAAAKEVPSVRVGGLEELEQRNDYLTLAEFARSALGVSRYTEVLRRLFDRRVQVPFAHRVVARTDYRGIVTTNFDRLLETAITQEREWVPASFTPEQVSALASALDNPDLFVFKLHGDIVSAESIVLTDQDYDRLILRNPHVRSFLQAIFLNYTVLFVGYSRRDPDFNLLIREPRLIFQGYTPQHYALSPNPPDFMFEHLRNVINVQLIPYSSSDDHSDVVRFLEQLRKAAPFETEPITDYVSRGQSTEMAVLD